MLDTINVQLTNLPKKDIYDVFKDYLPIATLIVGAIIGYFVDKFKTYSIFKNTRKYFFASLYYLNLGVKDQIKIINEYIELINTDITNFNPMPINLNFNTQLISSVPNNELYKIFVKGNKKAVYDMYIFKTTIFKIDSIIQLIDVSFLNLHKSYSNILKKFNDAITRYDFSIKSFRNEIDAGLFQKQGNLNNYITETDIINELDDIGNKFNSNRTTEKETTIFYYMYNYIQPSRKVFKKYNYNRFFDLLDELDYIFNELLDKRSSFIDYLNSERNSLLFVFKNQELLLNKYKKYLHGLKLNSSLN